MRLLVVEDEHDLAEAITRGLRRHGYAVDAAEDGEEAWDTACVNAYDLVILDLNLPGLNGLDLCVRLRAAQPALLILILTARDRTVDRVRGLDLGADDYLVKPFVFAELVARVRALLRRDLRVRAPLLHHRDLTFDASASVVWQGTRRVSLTGKELGILEYLLRHPGEVVSQEVLLEHVWDENANAFSNTVRVHLASLRRKLGATPYIETVIGSGYRLGSPDGGDVT